MQGKSKRRNSRRRPSFAKLGSPVARLTLLPVRASPLCVLLSSPPQALGRKCKPGFVVESGISPRFPVSSSAGIASRIGTHRETNLRQAPPLRARGGKPRFSPRGLPFPEVQTAKVWRRGGENFAGEFPPASPLLQRSRSRPAKPPFAIPLCVEDGQVWTVS